MENIMLNDTGEAIRKVLDTKALNIDYKTKPFNWLIHWLCCLLIAVHHRCHQQVDTPIVTLRQPNDQHPVQ